MSKPTRTQRLKHPDLWKRYNALTRLIAGLQDVIPLMKQCCLDCHESEEMLATMTRWKDNICLEMKK